MAMSANGNVLVSWLQASGPNVNVNAVLFSGGAWSAVQTISTGGLATNPAGTINDNGRAAISFVQSVAGHSNLMASNFNGSVWQGAASNLDDQGGVNNNDIAGTTQPSISMDAAGNVALVWSQRKLSTDTGESVFSTNLAGQAAATKQWQAWLKAHPGYGS